MARNLLPFILLVFIHVTAAADDPQVAAFDYELSLTSRPEGKMFAAIHSESKVLRVRVESVKKVPTGSVTFPISVIVASDPDGIVVNVNTETPFTSRREVLGQELPERGFYFEVNSLQFPEDDAVPMKLRFKDTTETYILRYTNDKGLQLEPSDAKHGKLVARGVPEFVNIKVADGKRIFQCNPLTISAMEGGRSKWSTDILMKGQPQSLTTLENVVFVESTGGHSFYVMKDTGEMLLYDSSLMSGRNASDDLLALWKRDMGLTHAEREKRGFFRFINAAVMLDEKRAIPLLIRCIEEGFGLNEKCAAIAALEKLNGNPKLWPSSYPPPPSYFLKSIGMNRVFPEENAKAERAKWEKVFASHLQE